MKSVERYWSGPVRITLEDGVERTFTNLQETLDFLENEWPTRHGKHYELAVELCLAAKNRHASLEVAREAFIGACIEASMQLHVLADFRVKSAGTQHQGSEPAAGK